MRSLFNKDIATGLLPVFDDLSTIGPSSTFHVKNIIPESPEPRCYILEPETCTSEQYATVLNDTAIVKDFFVVGNTADQISEVLLEGMQQKIMNYEDSSGL